MVEEGKEIKSKSSIGNNSPGASIDSKFTHDTQPILENTQTIPEKGSGPDGRYFPIDPDILSKKQATQIINETNEDYKIKHRDD